MKLTVSWHPVPHFTHYLDIGSSPTNTSTAGKQIAEDISFSPKALIRPVWWLDLCDILEFQ